ncbi:MAG: 4Fe-4S binding protein [candidate division WOR-3 bacterium]
MYSITVNYGPLINYELCNGCGECYKHCPMDVFEWNVERGCPEVKYVGECSFCCYCEILCAERAIDVVFPLHPLIDFGVNVAQLK